MGCCLWECEAADEAGRGSAFMWWYRPGSHAFQKSYRISFFSDWPSLSNVSDIAMGSWKNHVRARLQERDLNEKVPFLGVYTSCTQILHLVLVDVMMHAMMLTWTICLFSVLQLEERYEARKHILDDILSERYDGFAEALLLFWRLKAVFKNHIQYFVLFFFFFSSVNLSPVGLRLGEINSSNGNWGRANTWLKRSV